MKFTVLLTAVSLFRSNFCDFCLSCGSYRVVRAPRCEGAVRRRYRDWNGQYLPMEVLLLQSPHNVRIFLRSSKPGKASA